MILKLILAFCTVLRSLCTGYKDFWLVEYWIDLFFRCIGLHLKYRANVNSPSKAALIQLYGTA